MTEEQPTGAKPAKDPDAAFRTDHLLPNLGQRSVRGGTITMMSQGAKFLLGLVSTVVMARLLTPSDFGVVAKIAIFIGFAELAKDLGLSMASVQRPDVTHRLASNLFWINIGLSGLLGVAVAAIAPLVAWIYDDPRLVPVMFAFAGMFVLGGMAGQHQALLQRRMRFAALESCDLLARVLGFVAGIGFALAGFDYWSLVLSQAVYAGTFAFMLWPATGWLPGLPSRQASVRSMLTFGTELTLVRVLTHLLTNVDRVVIGKFAGDYATGLYDRSYRLILLPLQQVNTPITNVAIPALSRLQHEPERFRRAYLRSLSLLVTITAPLFVFMFVWADQIIRLMLGAQWADSADLFRIFALLGFSRPLASTNDWLFIATGRTRALLQWRLLTIWVIPVCVPIGFFLGSVEGVAIALTGTSWLLVVPSVWYATRGTSVGTWAILRTMLRPIAAASIAGVVMWPLVGRLDVIAAAVMMPAIYFALNCLIARSFEPVREIWHLRSAFAKARAA